MLDSVAARRLSICGLTELGAFQGAAVTHVLSILDPLHRSLSNSPNMARTSG
jgi:hypothetical protein